MRKAVTGRGPAVSSAELPLRSCNAMRGEDSASRISLAALVAELEHLCRRLARAAPCFGPRWRVGRDDDWWRRSNSIGRCHVGALGATQACACERGRCGMCCQYGRPGALIPVAAPPGPAQPYTEQKARQGTADRTHRTERSARNTTIAIHFDYYGREWYRQRDFLEGRLRVPGEKCNERVHLGAVHSSVSLTASDLKRRPPNRPMHANLRVSACHCTAVWQEEILCWEQLQSRSFRCDMSSAGPTRRFRTTSKSTRFPEGIS